MRLILKLYNIHSIVWIMHIKDFLKKELNFHNINLRKIKTVLPYHNPLK